MQAQKLLFPLIAILIALVYLAVSTISTEQQQQFSEKVFFCPEDNCSQQLAEKIDSAKNSIHIAVYSFTSQEIASAIIAAKERGVKVKIITDNVQAAGEYSKDELLKKEGIELKIKKISGGSMHNKFIVIDNSIVGTGSFNYTENADSRNDENLIFLQSPEIAADFEAEFQEIWKEAG